MRGPGVVTVSLFMSLLAVASLRADDFDAWIMNRGQVRTIGSPTEKRLPVGSLQKPFLAQAWASEHPREASPRFTCTRTSGCWRPLGHGTLDLRGAIRESCNTYFQQMARDTTSDAIRASFLDAGFSWTGELTPAEAIGLPGSAGVTIAPARLLASYAELVRRPWVAGDDVRGELLDGMRDAARSGTASGLRLWGVMSKTGTIPALDRSPLGTSGFAMIVDDAGFAFLGLLRRGTGRQAAIRSGDEIARIRTGLSRRAPGDSSRRPAPPAAKKRGLEDPVRVLMLDELRLAEVQLKNSGAAPLDSSRGFVGPGASVTVAKGDRYSAGEWKVMGRKPVFERYIRGAILVEADDGPIRLIATMSARDYADGVLKAELGTSTGALRAQLASAALRYLQRGARHPDAEVCDSTHCAWFVGEGPVPRWLRPDAARNDRAMARDLSDSEWAQAVRDARERPRGPDLWTADCGGDPVSAHFIWGGGDRRIAACPRHPRGSRRSWRREWPAEDLMAVFGSKPESMEVVIVDGQWRLNTRLAPREPSGGSTTLSLTYDDAHRRLAARLSWDALPAPASRVSRAGEGFAAEGVGFGHRVGLCLSP